MDTKDANRERKGISLIEIWRTPWWERLVYALTGIAFAASILVSSVGDANRSNWSIDMYLRWFNIESLFYLILFPLYVASGMLIIRRRRPGLWGSVPRWERTVYIVGAALLSLAFELRNLSFALLLLPLNWIEALPNSLFSSIDEIGMLCLSAAFPFIGAVILFMRRWEPEKWPELRQMWGLWVLLAGTLLLAIGSALGTFAPTTSAGQSPSNSSNLLPILIVVGIVLTFLGAVASVEHRRPGR